MYIGQTTSQANKQLNQPSERKNRNEDKMALPSSAEMKERINFIENHDRKKHLGDSFMWIDMALRNPKSSSSPSEVMSSRLDSMLDDVMEPEIPWEHLVIGKRIGLGFYEEVDREDWNGIDVAVRPGF
ncbi:Non-specific serine/threonine protein kinase protein [Dioscorea alata]|uniref:Non-specific serine/threonine protein kinase protein n=1 Tax=Dioscorea alata TaxID=55571 RepID=A0ACB7UZ76_DIOAL|nr:Non-specific serine/threonine protein kinase protein [Dioscorea alata]